jgi:hypothetical protein
MKVSDEPLVLKLKTVDRHCSVIEFILGLIGWDARSSLLGSPPNLDSVSRSILLRCGEKACWLGGAS